MKSTSILVALVAITAFFGTTNPSHADSTAIMINDTNALFTIDLKFTASGGTHEIPLAASSTVEHNDRVDVLGYNLAGAEVASANAIVLSKAQIDGTKYTLADGEAEAFVVFIIATLTEPLTSNLSATITKIPYWVSGTRTTVHQNQLDELSTVTVTAK